jgi:beta-galactosidase
MYIGVDYYPEHWPQERWETDARMMQEAGFNIVRLAEFAWVNMEPQEGKFEFSWLDKALDILNKFGIKAILGTPTAVMPAWVAHKYPETLATQKDGTRIVWGVRKNNCFSSGAYRMLSKSITRAMAEHFNRTPNVIGWQTDNEFGNPLCYCDTCLIEFQAWLKERYISLAELNRAWGTHFWGQGFGDWAEIPIPIDPSTYNPSACLDWQRFYSWLNVRFQHDQVQIIREICPHQFVTHNFMGLFHELDYYDLAEDLDHVSWDNYPTWGKPNIPYLASQAADLMRGLKKKNFWIMEQTAGSGGWGAYGRNPRPGEIRKIAFQQVAHGADHIIWFRWRSCTAGREQYWHGLLGHDGKGLRRYREAAQTAKDLHSVASTLQGTTLKPQVAINYDYDSIWAIRFQPGYSGNNYHAAMDRVYQALFRAGVNVDFIQSKDISLIKNDFAPYRLVLAPDLFILSDDVAQALCRFVEKGGVLFADSRTGVKNDTNLCYDRTLPGLLSDALGITIEEYESLSHEWDGDHGFTYHATGSGNFEGSYTATRTAEWVKPQTAEKLLGYEQWHMQEFASLTRNHFGEGWGYFLGTVIAESEFYDRMIADILVKAQIHPEVVPPSGVECSLREGNGKRLLFLLNHTEEVQSVTVPEGKDILLGGINNDEGKSTGKTITLDRYGVAVIQL